MKENIARKPTCPRNKNSETCDIYQPALDPRVGLRPIPAQPEEVSVTAIATLKADNNTLCFYFGSPF